MREFDVPLPDSRTLHAYEGGDADGSLVIYHHGTPMSGLLMDEWLTAGVRLVGFDRAGYGGSTRAPGRSIADAAADTAALADHLGADRFATWGISGGGPHALGCAALLPDRVTAVASLAGVAPYDATGLDFLAGMGQDNLDEFGAASHSEPALRAYLDRARTGLLGATPDELAREMETLLPAADLAWLAAGGATFLHAAMAHALAPSADGWLDDDLAFVAAWGFDPASISVPALVVQGDADLMVPFAHGQWLAAAIPGAVADLRPGGGHLELMAGVASVQDWLANPTAG